MYCSNSGHRLRPLAPPDRTRPPRTSLCNACGGDGPGACAMPDTPGPAREVRSAVLSPETTDGPLGFLSPALQQFPSFASCCLIHSVNRTAGDVDARATANGVREKEERATAGDVDARATASAVRDKGERATTGDADVRAIANHMQIKKSGHPLVMRMCGNALACLPFFTSVLVALCDNPPTCSSVSMKLRWQRNIQLFKNTHILA